MQRFQQSLKMWDAHALPEHGADGIYGCETNEWVKKYQEEMGVPATGNIDGVTAALLVLENLSRRPGS